MEGIAQERNNAPKDKMPVHKPLQ